MHPESLCKADFMTMHRYNTEMSATSYTLQWQGEECSCLHQLSIAPSAAFTTLMKLHFSARYECGGVINHAAMRGTENKHTGLWGVTICIMTLSARKATHSLQFATSHSRDSAILDAVPSFHVHWSWSLPSTVRVA